MTRDEAVTQVHQHLAFRSDKTAEIITHLKNSQVVMEGEVTLPWFLIEEMSEIDTEIGEERVPIPANFLRETEDSALWVFLPTAVETAQWVPLFKDASDYIRNKFQSATGQPERYSLMNKYFRLKPIPDDVYRLKMIYYKQDDLLDSNIENGWLKHAPEILVGMAGQRIAASLRDTTALQIFTVMETAARARLLGFSEARDHANRRYVMGGLD